MSAFAFQTIKNDCHLAVVPVYSNDFLHVASADKTKQNRDNCKYQQDVNKIATKVTHKAKQPSYNQDYCYQIKNASHSSSVLNERVSEY